MFSYPRRTLRLVFGDFLTKAYGASIIPMRSTLSSCCSTSMRIKALYRVFPHIIRQSQGWVRSLSKNSSPRKSCLDNATSIIYSPSIEMCSFSFQSTNLKVGSISTLSGDS
jgi:hypothetical protein